MSQLTRQLDQLQRDNARLLREIDAAKIIKLQRDRDDLLAACEASQVIGYLLGAADFSDAEDRDLTARLCRRGGR